MQRRLTQLLHWFGVDSIALGIVFGISLLFLPLALWRPGCLLAFTHLQWALILCALVRNGWLRTFRLN